MSCDLFDLCYYNTMSRRKRKTKTAFQKVREQVDREFKHYSLEEPTRLAESPVATDRFFVVEMMGKQTKDKLVEEYFQLCRKLAGDPESDIHWQAMIYLIDELEKNQRKSGKSSPSSVIPRTKISALLLLVYYWRICLILIMILTFLKSKSKSAKDDIVLSIPYPIVGLMICHALITKKLKIISATPNADSTPKTGNKLQQRVAPPSESASLGVAIYR